VCSLVWTVEMCKWISSTQVMAKNFACWDLEIVVQSECLQTEGPELLAQRRDLLGFLMVMTRCLTNSIEVIPGNADRSVCRCQTDRYGVMRCF